MGLEGSLAAEDRRRELMRLLRERGQVHIEDAAGRLAVHPMTIRRDLRGLEREGSARLVRGGAVVVGTEEFAVRQSRALSAKRRIAQKAVRLVAGHESLGIDASSTAFQVAELLPPQGPRTVVTYGIPAFQSLQNRRDARAFLTGGELDARTGSLVGAVASRTLASFALSCCVLSTQALHPDVGTTEPSPEEVEMKEALVAASERVVLLVDSGKLGQRSAVRSIALRQVDTLVTELPPSDPRLDPYRDLVELV